MRVNRSSTDGPPRCAERLDRHFLQRVDWNDLLLGMRGERSRHLHADSRPRTKQIFKTDVFLIFGTEQVDRIGSPSEGRWSGDANLRHSRPSIVRNLIEFVEYQRLRLKLLNDAVQYDERVFHRLHLTMGAPHRDREQRNHRGNSFHSSADRYRPAARGEQPETVASLRCRDDGDSPALAGRLDRLFGDRASPPVRGFFGLGTKSRRGELAGC
jgi:hypothetical protein